MKLKLFFIALSAVFIFCGVSFAAQTVKGDVIVIFYNPFPEIPVTKESLSLGNDSKDIGVHAEYIKNVAGELDAKVSIIYETLSVENNNIMALFHTDSRSETDLWFDLRIRKDVKGASLNHIARPAKNKSRAR